MVNLQMEVEFVRISHRLVTAKVRFKVIELLAIGADHALPHTMVPHGLVLHSSSTTFAYKE